MELHHSKTEHLLWELHAALRELEIAAQEYRIRQLVRKRQVSQSVMNNGKAEMKSVGGSSHNLQQESLSPAGRNAKHIQESARSLKVNHGNIWRFLNAVHKIWLRIRRGHPTEDRLG